MSAQLAARWNGACERLGVKPRQFAVLLAVAATVIGALAARSALRPARAAARPGPEAAAPAVTSPAAAPAAPRSWATGIPAEAPELHVRPARDPFRPFFAVSSGASQAADPDRGTRGPLGRAPSGMVLKAIIAGEYAVIGNDTVAVGDEVADGEGRRFIVEEIHERRVVLREGASRSELGYSATRPATAGTSVPPARGGRR